MNKPTILLVDDQEKNLLALEAILNDLDTRILKAASGVEALEISDEEDLALILMDVQMPEMDGFQTAELLRAQKATRHIPIIFVTAISQEQKHIFRGYESGAVDYLFKPLDSVILKSKVKIFIELYQHEQALVQKTQMLEKKTQELEDSLTIQNDLNNSLLEASMELKNLNKSLQNDLQLARDFQKAMIYHAEQFYFLKIAEKWLPCSEVSGDIYRISTNRDGASNIFLGDAMGHGITAAFVTMMTQIALNNVPAHLSPREVMSQINGFLASQQMEEYTTGIYCRITSEGQLTLSNAGHPAVIVIPEDATEPKMLKKSAMPLGLFFNEPLPYVEETYILQPGDQILIYSDGITEWGNKDQFGKERLMISLQKHSLLEPKTILAHVLEEAQTFAQCPCDDDITLLLIQFTG